MIKVIVHVTKVIIAIAASLLLLSCGIDGFKHVDGNGKVATKSRPVTGTFKAINAERGLEVIIEQQSTISITVEADENLQQHIKTEIVDGELQISSDVNINDAAAKRIIVRMPVIESIETSSSAHVKSKNTLKGDAIAISGSSGSFIEVSLEANSINCDASSGSHLTISGKTESLETDSSSGSHIDAKGLTAKNVISNVSSGAHTYTNPTESLKGDASSGGHIYYVNAPASINKNTSSGGSINKE